MASKALPAASQNVDLGDSGTGNVTTKVMQFFFSAAYVASIVIQGRVLGSGGGFKPIPYKKQYLNGAVGDQSWGSAPITGDSIIEVDSTGQEIRLVITYTSGGPGEVVHWDVNG